MSGILHSNTPSPAKAAHYNASLTAALLRGAWAESSPGQAPNKTDLSWGELVRKWGKHTNGNTNLIHHLRDISLLYLSTTSHPATSSSGFITVPTPSSPRTIANVETGLGSSNSSNDSGTGSHSSFVHIPHPHLRHKKKPSLDAGLTTSPSATGSGSTIRPTESSIGTASGSKASYLSSGDLDGDDSEDHRYWAEGNGWWTGLGSESFDEVREGIKALEGMISGGRLSPAESTSANLTLAYNLHALGSYEDALRIYNALDWNTENRFGVVEGDAAVLERIRGRCLQGLSYELLQSPNYNSAIESYLATIPLLKSLTSFNLPIPSYISSQRPFTLRFEPLRELNRHLSTALTRAAILSARTRNADHEGLSQTLRILRTYHAFGSSWPAGFRPVQRQKMLNLYFRALSASYPPAGQSPPESPLLYGGSTKLSARAMWNKEVVEAIRQGRTHLSATTSFPKAGSVNTPVIAFTELAVSLYSRSADLGREVISLLWWAMTLTFQSQTILRHLTHLLSDVGDSADARRVFELYVQLVLKARETQQPEISLKLKQRPTDDDDAAHSVEPVEIKKEAQMSDHDDIMNKDENSGSEIDSDQQFVETLLGGTRLLCRDLGEAEEAWRYACLAGDVIEVRPVKTVLRARVEESKGIVRMATAAHGADAINRPTYQAQAINHLVASTDLSPTASGYYHLAHCQAEARSIDAATDSIRSSLELDPRNVQAWHLLALLLTARRDWEGATKACEAGISVWEQDEEILASEEEFGTMPYEDIQGGRGRETNPDDYNVESRDFAVIPPSPSSHSIQLSTIPQILLSDGSFPHLSISPPHTTPLSHSARLEHVIRLRMTLNVIYEKTHGAEIAMLKQQELFAFFSARSGRNRGKLGYSTGFGKGGGMKSIASTGSLAALGTGTTTGSADDKEGLGGSFISVGMNEAPASVSVQPPTPNVEKAAAPFILADPISEKSNPPINIQASTPSSRSIISDQEKAPDPIRAQGQSDAKAEVSDDDTEKPRRSLSIRSKRNTDHLHVPGASGAGAGASSGSGNGLGNDPTPACRAGSVRKMNTGPTHTLVAPRERAASAAHSLAPTAIHSHFRNAPSSRTIAPPPPPLTTPDDHGRTPAESRILSNLWLMSAATFRRWGKPDQSLVAIEEAEVLDPENADVWVQLGLYHAAAASASASASASATSTSISASAADHGHADHSGDYARAEQAQAQGQLNSQKDNANLNQAEAAFVKSLLLRPDHSPAIVGLSKLYLETSQVDLAESLLNQLTQEGGWDVAEGWFWLGKVSERQGRAERARECWLFALGLEQGRGVRSWHEVGRWL